MKTTTKTLLTSVALTGFLATGALADIAMTGMLTDAADGNRFFTRLGGTANETLAYTGAEAGTDYVLTTDLIDAATGDVINSVETPFTAEADAGELVVSLPVPPNTSDVNIDYITTNTLRAADGEAALLTMTGEAMDPERAIQVHSIQRVSLVSVNDASDGDQRIDGQGGTVEAVVRYENMVEGYAYVLGAAARAERPSHRRLCLHPRVRPRGQGWRGHADL